MSYASKLSCGASHLASWLAIWNSSPLNHSLPAQMTLCMPTHTHKCTIIALPCGSQIGAIWQILIIQLPSQQSLPDELLLWNQTRALRQKAACRLRNNFKSSKVLQNYSPCPCPCLCTVRAFWEIKSLLYQAQCAGYPSQGGFRASFRARKLQISSPIIWGPTVRPVAWQYQGHSCLEPFL